MQIASEGTDPIVTTYGEGHEDVLEDIALTVMLTRQDLLAMLKREDDIEEWIEAVEKCIRSKVEAANEIFADIDARLEALEDRMGGRNAGLAREVGDAFKLLNDHQLQINKLRRERGVLPGESLLAAMQPVGLAEGCEYPDCEPPQGAAEGAMSHVTRPADDDASEWSETPYEKAWREHIEAVAENAETLAADARARAYRLTPPTNDFRVDV